VALAVLLILINTNINRREILFLIILYTIGTFLVLKWGLYSLFGLTILLTLPIYCSVAVRGSLSVILASLSTVSLLLSPQISDSISWITEEPDIWNALLLSLLFLGIFTFSKYIERDSDNLKLEATSSRNLLSQTEAGAQEALLRRSSLLTTDYTEKLALAQRYTELGNKYTNFIHDTATPLNNIGLNLELLKQATDKNGRAEVFQRLESSFNFLANILESSRITVRLLAEEYSLTERINNSIYICSEYARSNKCKITFSTPKETIILRGNGIYLEQALVNLLKNSIEACIESTEKVVTVSLERLQETLVIKVSDTGCGFSNADLSRLSEAFYSTKISNNSLGIGLSIIQTSINKLGGSISYDSKPKQGTLATIRLIPS
jgi:signal transduction histidine kinase